MSTAIVFFIDRKTRSFNCEELPEWQIRKMNRVERVFKFMLNGDDKYLKEVAELISNGYAVYRVID